MAPYLAEFPRANGPSLGRGWPSTTFRSTRSWTSTSCRDASTTTSAPAHQIFGRYTLDDADQFLPTDYPQFPREFFSRNQFFTGEYRHVFSGQHAEHRRGSASAARASARTSRRTRRSRCASSCPGRGIMGDIDIGGLKRFGPQSSAQPAPGAERVQPAGRPRPHARPPPAQGRRRWPSTTRTTWSTRRSASASTVRQT